jgi:hypothetical protein
VAVEAPVHTIDGLVAGAGRVGPGRDARRRRLRLRRVDHRQRVGDLRERSGRLRRPRPRADRRGRGPRSWASATRTRSSCGPPWSGPWHRGLRDGDLLADLQAQDRSDRDTLPLLPGVEVLVDTTDRGAGADRGGLVLLGGLARAPPRSPRAPPPVRHPRGRRRRGRRRQAGTRRVPPRLRRPRRRPLRQRCPGGLRSRRPPPPRRRAWPRSPSRAASPATTTSPTPISSWARSRRWSLTDLEALVA